MNARPCMKRRLDPPNLHGSAPIASFIREDSWRFVGSLTELRVSSRSRGGAAEGDVEVEDECGDEGEADAELRLHALGEERLGQRTRFLSHLPEDDDAEEDRDGGDVD